jgi:hypothetical protein
VSQLFAVRMDVALPPDMDPAERGDLLVREKAHSQEWPRGRTSSGRFSHTCDLVLTHRPAEDDVRTP